MTLKSFVYFLIFILMLSGLSGCQTVQKTLVDTMPTESSEDDIFIDSTPIKLVSLIDYQEDGRDAYLFQCQNPAALARGCRHRSCIVSRQSLEFVQDMWYPISIIRIGKQSPTLCRCPIHSIALVGMMDDKIIQYHIRLYTMQVVILASRL